MTDHDVIIVGAGFGGMGAAISLKRLGRDDIVILEREDDLGGTWHVNHYPGLAVDIASVTYSYSFEPNPWWEHGFARGAELTRYAEHVADTSDLRWTQRLARRVNSTCLETLMVTGVLHYKQARLFNQGAAAMAKAHLRRQ